MKTLKSLTNNKTSKQPTKLRMPYEVGTRFRRLIALSLIAVLLLAFALPASAEPMDNPDEVIKNFAKFIFGIVRAIGIIVLLFGVVQVGLALKSHDPSQRANGFLVLAGGVLITFAKEILKLIAPNAMAGY